MATDPPYEIIHRPSLMEYVVQFKHVKRGNEAIISYVCTAMLGTAVDPLTCHKAKCVLTT